MHADRIRGRLRDDAILGKIGEDDKIVAAKEEEDIYAALGLPFIAPELREGQGEIQRALKRKLPNLVSDKDICGILHAHTDLSDGVDTLDAMAEATRIRRAECRSLLDSDYGPAFEQPGAHCRRFRLGYKSR